MKTAISVPNETFARASRRAAELGMSRSEFFSRAADHFLDDLDAESITAQIDVAVETISGRDDSNVDAVTVGHRLLDSGENDW